MPDQSSASTEHALMQEITAPLAALPDDPLPVVADVDFPIVLRGYERDAVDSYVQRTSQLVAELQATRSPDAAVRRALERVGEEVSGILQRAHDTGAQITSQSRSEAEDRLETARQEAAQIVARAEERVRELDAETDRIWAERHRILEDMGELARELLTLTESAADRFPADQAVAGADPASAVAGPASAAIPDAAVRAGPFGVEVPVEGALPDDVPVGEHDPHVEPTAILPIVEPPEYDPERPVDSSERVRDESERVQDESERVRDESERVRDESERLRDEPEGPPDDSERPADGTEAN